jgi:septal ring factor EnvC (AmiA/AmiB activator)
LGFSAWFCIFNSKAQPEDLGAELSSRKDKLTKIREELDGKRRSVERLNQSARSTFAEILNLEDRLELDGRLITRLVSQEQRMDQALQAGERSLQETDLKFWSYRQSSAKRLKEISKRGKPGPAAGLLGVCPPLEWGSWIRFARRIVLEDQHVLQMTRALKAKLEDRRQDLGKARPEVSWLRKRKAEEQIMHQMNLEEKQKLLKKIKSEKALHALAIRELEEQASEISRLLGHLVQEDQFGPEREEGTAGWFEALRGKLPWPVKGRVASHFGQQRDPRFYTTTENSGIEIEAESGSEVVAVAQGKVIYASRLRGYGNFLILAHDGEYYTLYARLSKALVTPGTEVERFQRIGIVGGDGPTSIPRLHFEIRKGKQSQDPLEWLR